LLWIGIIIFFCRGASRWLSGRDRFGHFYRSGEAARGPFYEPGQAPFEPDALEILRRRYARGEIDGATFDQMCERLESSARPNE
jgi:putative membrane protein